MFEQTRIENSIFIDSSYLFANFLIHFCPLESKFSPIHAEFSLQSHHDQKVLNFCFFFKYLLHFHHHVLLPLCLKCTQIMLFVIVENPFKNLHLIHHSEKFNLNLNVAVINLLIRILNSLFLRLYFHLNHLTIRLNCFPRPIGRELFLLFYS